MMRSVWVVFWFAPESLMWRSLMELRGVVEDSLWLWVGGIDC